MEGEDEDFGEEMEEVVVGQMPTTMVRRHIKKRALRNKSLSVSFDDKKLRDFVTGFHKRKKKRRKEAQRHLQEKERLKRIEARKKRKLEMELALNPGGSGPEADEDGNGVEVDEPDLNASVSETMTYENADTTIRVTMSEISHEDEDLAASHFIPKLSSRAGKNHDLLVKKKPLKRTTKQKHCKKAKKLTSQKKEKRRKGNK